MGKLFNIVNKYLEQIVLFEQRCVLCGCTSDKQICADCFHELNEETIHHTHCPRCLINLPPKEIHCANCSENNFQFERIIKAFDYGHPLDRILHQLKYSAKLEYTSLLSQLFWHKISRQLHELPDAIIPIPLHKNKQQQRGFNQVHELLREFRQQNPKTPLIIAQRTKETQQQAALNRQQRLTNLTNAFMIDIPLAGKKVAIIDDVVTSGTTVNEMTKLCKKLGAQQVTIWCLMRAQH